MKEATYSIVVTVLCSRSQFCMCVLSTGTRFCAAKALVAHPSHMSISGSVLEQAEVLYLFLLKPILHLLTVVDGASPKRCTIETNCNVVIRYAYLAEQF